MYHLRSEFNQDAEPLYLQALRIEEKAHGGNHPDLAEPLYRLADFYRTKQRPAEAEPLYQRSMSILDVQPELDELNTRWMRSGYAEFLRETDRDAEATELEQRWGEWNAFEEMVRNQIATRETTFGPDSPELAESLEHLANTCLFQENYDEAEKLYQRALSIRETALGPDDSTIPESLMGLARIRRIREQYADAEKLVQRAAGIYQASFGKDSVEYARTQEYLASLANAQQETARAEELVDVAVTTYRKIAHRESREYAEGLYRCACFYAALDQFEKAEAVVSELMEIAEKDIDVADLEKADYFQLYANVLEKLGRTEEAKVQHKRAEDIFAAHRDE
jgi:tetratricopeptide (TPR) repeat protein